MQFCYWEPKAEATMSYLAETCAAMLESGQTDFHVVSKYLAFLSPGRIIAAHLFGLEKGWLWSKVTLVFSNIAK